MRFSRYILAGLANTGITYILYIGLLNFFPYIWAYSITYMVGIGVSYVFNTWWVFRGQPSLRSAAIYPLTYGLNYLLSLSLLWLLVDLMSAPKKLAPLLVVMISVPLLYFANKLIFIKGAKHE